jgi:hypothetical protein
MPDITTIGQLRQHLLASNATWAPPEHLPDDAPLQHFSTGGDASKAQPASAAPPVDFKAVLPAQSSNPLLTLRRNALFTGHTQTLPANLSHPVIANIALKAEDAAPAPPALVDWRSRWGGLWLASIQNQGACGNCWAFASAALVESMVRIEHGAWSKRSEGDIRDGWLDPRTPPFVGACAHGAGIQDALTWITQNGVADPECYAYVDHDQQYTPTADRSGRTVRIPTVQSLGSMDDVKRWLDTVGPVAAHLDVWQSFMNHGSGVWTLNPAIDIAGPDKNTPSINWPGSHILLIVGYDDAQKAWILRNSWGTGWGVGGYGLLGYGQANIDSNTRFGLQQPSPDPWTRRRLHNGCLIESSDGASHRNFEALLPTFEDIKHVWRDGDGALGWHLAGPTQAKNEPAICNGVPAFTSTTYGRNFETVFWHAASSTHPNGLRHQFFDQAAQKWNDGGSFGPADVGGYPGFIQSSYGAPGNLEVVFRTTDGKLCHWWREDTAPWRWQELIRFGANVLQSGPSLIQSHAGTGILPGDFTGAKPGNLELVAVLTTGQMQHWWRDDSKSTPDWEAGAIFGADIPNTPVCMIEGAWGTKDETSLGNFELCVSTGWFFEHWWRDNAGDGQWHKSGQFGSRVKHVWGMIQSSWGNLEIIVETIDSGYQHYFRDGNGWHAGPMITW